MQQHSLPQLQAPRHVANRVAKSHLVAVNACADAEGGPRDSGRLKTKVRRLYDVANILSSLRLLEKTQQPDSRKPAFRWLGAEARIASAPAATLKHFFRCRLGLAYHAACDPPPSAA